MTTSKPPAAAHGQKPDSVQLTGTALPTDNALPQADALALFCCPLCGDSLQRTGQTLRCGQGHCHDVAREGYVHLLPASRMHSKAPGDSREMVQARHAFLQAGFYAPFAQALCELLGKALQGVNTPFVVDAGCGEGYYTQQVALALAQAGLSPRVAAFDVSKHAVRTAARHASAHGVGYAVASSFAIPLPTACADVLVNVFSPVAAQEFARVLKRGGLFLYAVPGPRHLYGMKEILYETPYENPVQAIEYRGFMCEGRVPVQGEITVRDAQVMQLFAMTPYYWNTPPQGAQRLAQHTQLTTPIHFDFLLYRKQ